MKDTIKTLLSEYLFKPKQLQIRKVGDESSPLRLEWGLFALFVAPEDLKALFPSISLSLINSNTPLPNATNESFDNLIGIDNTDVSYIPEISSTPHLLSASTTSTYSNPLFPNMPPEWEVSVTDDGIIEFQDNLDHKITIDESGPGTTSINIYMGSEGELGYRHAEIKILKISPSDLFDDNFQFSDYVTEVTLTGFDSNIDLLDPSNSDYFFPFDISAILLTVLTQGVQVITQALLTTTPTFLSISNATVTEGGDLIFTVTRSGDLSGTDTVQFETNEGTAEEIDDYLPNMGTLTFLPGVSTLTVIINTVDDSVFELLETMTLTLSNATGGAIIIDGAGLGTILDDEPGVIVTPTSGLVTTESGGTDTFTVTLNTIPTGDVTIQITSDIPTEDLIASDSTLGAVVPLLTLTFTTSNWFIPQTVTVIGQDDAFIDGDILNTIILAPAVSFSDPNYNGFDPDDVMVLNLNDDFVLTLNKSFLSDGGFTGDPSAITPNAILSYTLTIANPAASVFASSIDISDILSTDLTLVSNSIVVTDGNGAVSNFTDFSSPINAGSLAPTQTATITFDATINSDVDLDDNINNSFDVNFILDALTQGTFTSNTVTATINIGFIDVTLQDNTAGDVVVAPGATPTSAPGAAVLSFFLTNTGLGIDDFSLVATDTGGDDFDTVSSSIAIYLDDGDGNFDSTLDTFYMPGINEPTLSSGQSLEIFVVATIPTTGISDGDKASISLTAESLKGTGSPGDFVTGPIQGGFFLGPSGGDATATDTFSVNVPPGISVSAISGDTTESGGTATFTVVLDKAPTSNVMLSISSDNPSEGLLSDDNESLSSPITLTFTPGDWFIPQIVTVTGQDDALVDGDVPYTIDFMPATGASEYAGITPASINVTNDDNEFPGVTLEKSADVSSYNSAENMINYTYLVTNTGNVALTNVTLVDDAATPGSPGDDFNPTFDSGDDNNNNELDPGEIWTYTSTHTVSQAEFNANSDIVNIATLNTNETSSETATVTVNALNPLIEIQKSVLEVDPTGDGQINSAGDTIIYQLQVTNPGNVALNSISINDSIADSITSLISGDSNTNNILDVDETWVYHATYTVTQDDIDSFAPIENKADVDGRDPEDNLIIDEDTFNFTNISRNPQISLVKTATVNDNDGFGGNNISSIDDDIDYEYTVTNTGNVTLTNVSLRDDGGTDFTSFDDFFPTFISGDTDSDNKLDVGETWIYRGNINLTQDQIDQNNTLTNRATVFTSEGAIDTDDTTVQIDRNADVTLSKSEESSGPYTLGQMIEYKYLVENTGNITLENISLTDNNVDNQPNITSSGNGDTNLDVGEFWFFEAFHTVTQDDVNAGDVFNQAEVTASPIGGGGLEMDMDDFTVMNIIEPEVPDPELPLGDENDPDAPDTDTPTDNVGDVLGDGGII